MIHQEYYTTTINVGVHFVNQLALLRSRNSYVLRAVSVHLFIFIFLIPVTTLQRGRRTNGEAGEAGVGWEEIRWRASVDSPCQMNDSFRAGKSLDSHPGVPRSLPYFFPAPVGPWLYVAENSSLLQNYTLAFLRNPKVVVRRTRWDTSVKVSRCIRHYFRIVTNPRQ